MADTVPANKSRGRKLISANTWHELQRKYNLNFKQASHCYQKLQGSVHTNDRQPNFSYIHLSPEKYHIPRIQTANI